MMAGTMTSNDNLSHCQSTNSVASITRHVLLLSFVVVVSATSSASPFPYTEIELQACANTKAYNDEEHHELPCGLLYRRFLDHYHRPSIHDDSLGYFHFKQTVQMIYKHNQHLEAVHKSNKLRGKSLLHTLRLNQFADMPSSHTRQKHQNDEKQGWQDDLENFWDTNNIINEQNDRNSDHRPSRILRWQGSNVRLFESLSSIKSVFNEEQPYSQPSRSLLKGSTPGNLKIVSHSSKHHTEVMMPGDGTNTPPAFSSPQVPELLFGTEVELHKGRRKKSHQGNPPLGNKFSTSLDWSTNQNPDGVPLVHDVFDQGTCGSCWAFAATGSVEASAARNAARDHFIAGLIEIDDERIEDDDDEEVHTSRYHTLIEDLVNESRAIEEETFIDLRLSIQQLLDCDGSVDEGCVGGNPIMAFYYIHEHGLVPWEEYPYEGYGKENDDSSVTSRLHYDDDAFPSLLSAPEHEESNEDVFSDSLSVAQSRKQKAYAPSCRKAKITDPIATVKSWGLLHKNHEDLIQYALLYIGPVAVGINGADPTFINYGGGIFDNPKCDQAANHALLIVGFDQEEVVTENGDTNIIRYWIARNSWGTGWGENGFVRIKRGSGKKGVPGVCGIARSPSVALGGVYRNNRYTPLDNEDTLRTTSRYREGKYVTEFDTSASLHLQHRRNHPTCYSFFASDQSHLFHGCAHFSSTFQSNQPIFVVLICLMVALVGVLPLGLSLLRQHRLAVGNGSFVLEAAESSLRSSQRSFASGTLSERTHLLTLKEMYANARHEEESVKKSHRGRIIVMKTPDQDPFRLEPSAHFGSDSDHEEK